MSDNVNAVREADKIEQLAVNFLNAHEADRGIELARLSCELASISPQELRDALKVMDQRESFFNNRPSVYPRFDGYGNIKTVSFGQWLTPQQMVAVDSQLCETK